MANKKKNNWKITWVFDKNSNKTLADVVEEMIRAELYERYDIVIEKGGIIVK